MDEEIVEIKEQAEAEAAPAEAAPAEAAPAKPKQKRHFILWVLLIGLGLMLHGELLGQLLVMVPQMLWSIPDRWSFSLMYFAFIGIDLLVLGYCALAEKELMVVFRPAKRGGLAGNNGKEFLLGLLIGFIMNGVCILAAWLHGDLDFSMGRFYPVYLIVTFLCVMVQSGAEELLTRGYMLGALRERYPLWVAVLANSLLFGALHLTNPGITVISFLDIVLTGVAFSLVVVWRDSLWMAVALHTMWNFTQSILFGLPNSGIVSQGSLLHLEAAKGSLFYDPVFGVEGTWLAILVQVALGLWVWLSWRKKRQ